MKSERFGARALGLYTRPQLGFSGFPGYRGSLEFYYTIDNK